MLHPEALPHHTLALLKTISSFLGEQGFYLAGGTALSLRLGHRVSVDLDFFSPRPFTPENIKKPIELACGHKGIITQKTQGSICLVLNESKVELLHYPYPLISSLETLNGIPFCSLADNGAMKLSALTNRGSKKDFFDVAKMLETHPLETWLNHHKIKFPHTDVFTVIKSLTWFEDAETEPDPVVLQRQSWPMVKKRICEAVSIL